MTAEEHLTKPQVSIIVPNYNHALFLEQRMESILNQTHQNFELILLDDASTDSSQEVLKAYAKHARVSHLVLNEENSGSVFNQWAKGLQLVTGDFVWIAESDDFADVTFLEKALPHLEANTEIGLVFTDTQKVTETGEFLKRVSESKKPLRNLGAGTQIINTSQATSFLLKKLVIVNASSVLFRAAALKNLDYEALGRFKNVGDVFTYLHVASGYSLFYLNSPLNFMRLHTKNTTGKIKKSGLIYQDKLYLLDYYLDNFKMDVHPKGDVLLFFYGLFFYALDFGYSRTLKGLLSKLNRMDYITDYHYRRLLLVVKLYLLFIFNGRPGFLRARFKTLVKKSLTTKTQ